MSILDIGSGAETAFTAPPGSAEFDFTLDGSKIAYSGLDENGYLQLFVMDADGSNARQVTHHEGGVDARGLNWSSDGSMIAYEADTPTKTQIFVARVSDGVSTMVTREPQGAVDPGGWTTNGESILFSSFNPPIDHYSALFVDLTTGRSRLIVPDASTPALSPDGAWIAFNSWLKPRVRLMLAKNDGSNRRVIAARFSITDGFEKWSPDSTQIAYIGAMGDGFGTYVYDLASRETRFVTAREVVTWVDDDHILVS